MVNDFESFSYDITGLQEAMQNRAFPYGLRKVTFLVNNSIRAERLSQLLSDLLPGNVLSPDGTYTCTFESIKRWYTPTPPDIFVCMPFSSDMDDVWVRIQSAARSARNLVCERIDTKYFPGPIVDEIEKRIESAPEIIADLSRSDANVYFEVGYAVGKTGRYPILMKRGRKRPKFMLEGVNCVFYKDSRQVEEDIRDILKERFEPRPVEGPRYKRKNARDIISEADQMDFPKYVSRMVGELSLGDETIEQKAYEVMRLALRWTYLVDYSAEENDTTLLKEAENQLAEIYRRIPESFASDLTAIKNEALKYFDYEKELRRRIQKNEVFTSQDRRRYLYGKSGDALFYGKLLEAVTPAWNLTDELQTQIILYDIGKDITDYEKDVKRGLSNILCLYFSGQLEKMRIPNSQNDALRLAKELGVSKRILQRASELKEDTLKHKRLDRSPTLKDTIIDHYDRLRQLLGSSV